MIDLQSELLEKIGAEIFEKILVLHGYGVKSPGICIFIKIPAIDDQIKIIVGEPSRLAQVNAVNNFLRTERLNQATSQNSGSAGCITYQPEGGHIIYVSVDGFMGSERVVVSVVVMKLLTGVVIKKIFADIRKRGGKLPEEFSHKNTNLSRLLQGYMR